MKQEKQADPINQQLPAVRHEQLWTWANGVTVLRLIAGALLFAFAALTNSPLWNYAGLAVYWSLDNLDGFLARVCRQETRIGAQLDILADRLLAAFFYLNLLRFEPQLVVPIVLFLLEFMILDQYLSYQFLRWPILSPNYFYRIDRQVWLLNWSVPGKVFNTGLVTILVAGTRSVVISALVVSVLILVKLYSCLRLLRLSPDVVPANNEAAHGSAEPNCDLLPASPEAHKVC